MIRNLNHKEKEERLTDCMMRRRELTTMTAEPPLILIFVVCFYPLHYNVQLCVGISSIYQQTKQKMERVGAVLCTLGCLNKETNRLQQQKSIVPEIWRHKCCKNRLEKVKDVIEVYVCKHCP